MSLRTGLDFAVARLLRKRAEKRRALAMKKAGVPAPLRQQFKEAYKEVL